MDHIRQFDWCYSQPDLQFLNVEDFENSATEKILRNKFRDPLISSDSDDDKPTIDWEKLFTEKQSVEKFRRLYVPGLRQVPQYPKVSAIAQQQHYQCMKVLCHQNPHILELDFMPRPTKGDYRVFEEIKEIYEKEQKEYQEWAKLLWFTSHCTRALRPKPPVETTYEARFNMKAHEFDSYPSNYKMAAQIPLDIVQSSEIIHVKDLINVNVKDLPQIRCEPLTKHLTIMKHVPVPEPCNRHKCKFVLPNEKSVTELPLTEVQRELAQYAADNDAQFIASESALKCLLELDHSWLLPVAVCEVFGPDGDTRKVVVLGSDFAMQRESVLVRTYRAFKLLLEHFLIPPSERAQLLNRKNETEPSKVTNDKPPVDADSSDDEDNMLCIDEAQMQMDVSDDENLIIDDTDLQNNETDKLNDEIDEQKDEMDKEKNINEHKNENSNKRIAKKQNNKPCKDEFFNCSCKDTPFEMPPRRSYRKWQLRSDSGDTCHMIVHCAHRLRDESGEVVVEPIPEYQIDVGASELPASRTAALALALRLRTAATLLTVRVDNTTGDVISYERRRLDADANAIAARLHSATTHLVQLNTGHYVLKHEPAHGANALLYATCGAGAGAELSLVPQREPQPDDAAQLRVPPTLAPVLLPVHKFRKQLPCAFSPYEKQVRPPRPQPRQRTPPQAIKWPKKKKKNKKK